MAPSSRALSANISLPARRTRQRSVKKPCCIASPMAARPNTTASAISSDALSASSTSMRRARRARSNKMVSCGSQASCAPSPSSSLTSISAFGPVERYIFSAAALPAIRLAPSPSPICTAKRSPPVMPPPVLTITASSACDPPLGKRTRSEPSSCTRVRRVRPPAAATRNAMCPVARLAAKISALLCKTAIILTPVPGLLSH